MKIVSTPARVFTSVMLLLLVTFDVSALLRASLEAHGELDSSSIEVNRRHRRAKTDRLDAGKLLGMLLRYLSGETRVWKVVRVPTQEEEDRRHLHRELKTAKQARTAVTNRIKGLLATVGVRLSEMKRLPQQLEQVRLWTGPDHRRLLPASMLLGALLLLIADTAARSLFAPAELPIGVLTALIGGPFFIGLLLRYSDRAEMA